MRDFNFFEPYIGKKSNNSKQDMVFGIAVGCFFILFIGVFAVNCFKIGSLEREVKFYSDKLKSKQVLEELKACDEVNKKLEITKRYFSLVDKAYESVMKNGTINTKLMSKISATLPSGVSFQNMSITSQDINIQGTADKRTAVAELERNFKGTDSFYEVYVMNISQGKTGEYTFALKCKVRDVDLNENNK